MARKRKPRVIHIHGKRWFEKTNGNTYHSVRVWVDGDEVHYAPCQYGYGDQYRQTAQEWLHANGYLPGLKQYPTTGTLEPLRQYRDRVGIKLVDEVTDVGRKRDL